MENVDGGDKDDDDESSEDEVMKLVLLSISLHSHMQDKLIPSRPHRWINVF